MWLMTQYGFFSVARQGEDSALYLVRARVRNDLENLRRLAQLDSEIIESEDADYRYRIFISGDELETVMSVLAQTVDYENFKQRIEELPDQKQKSRAYHQVWALLRDLPEPASAGIGREDDPRFWPADASEIEAMFQEVVVCGQTGEHEHALELLDEIIAKAPGAPVPHWLRGVHLGSLGRH